CELAAGENVRRTIISRHTERQTSPVRYGPEPVNCRNAYLAYLNRVENLPCLTNEEILILTMASDFQSEEASVPIRKHDYRLYDRIARVLKLVGEHCHLLPRAIIA